MVRKIVKVILNNKAVAALIFFYIFSMISIIKWGIPNQNHPFNYHMDEWHQLQSVRSLFQDGSSNVSGAAHGPIFQFAISGVYLGILAILGIINPFAIQSSLTEIAVQEKLFVLLRLNTLLFGTMSLFLLGTVARKFFKANQYLAIVLFLMTPVWLSLSNYFKYDIALIFWILVSIFFLLRFGTLPTLKNYLWAGFFCSLAVSTKISALPLFIIYIAAFFYFRYKKQKKFLHLLAGVCLFFLAFFVFGIPDLLLQKGDYREFFYSNLIADPNRTENYLLDYKPWWVYTVFKIVPLNFGYPFFIIYAAAISYWIKQLFSEGLKRGYVRYRNEIFLLFAFLIFASSLIPLKIGANGNRLLVLLPFLSILSASFLTILWKQCSKTSRKILLIFFTVIIVLQAYQSFVQVVIKWDKDVRETSSIWLGENIRDGEKIGIENIPIYQMLPDIVLKEFYLKQYFPHKSTRYNYMVINESSKVLPNVVIVTDREFGVNYQKNSSKKMLIIRLEKEKYKIMTEFKPRNLLYNIFGNELNMRISGLVPIPTITIYKKT